MSRTADRQVPVRRSWRALLLAAAVVLSCGLVLAPAIAGASTSSNSVRSTDETPAVAPPGRAKLTKPADGLVGKVAPVVVTVGASTTTVTLSVNGSVVATKSCVSGQRVSFGRVRMPSRNIRFDIVVANSAGATDTFTYKKKRLSYPWATCLVVDKSDFRIYFVHHDELIKSYRIAHGKRSTPTPVAVWRVDSKEYSSGVSGPRKLRLFRRLGRKGHYHYSRTRYGIHGTNEPWVIGTMASHGCIRLKNKDILDLWPRVPLHTMVITRR